MGDVSARDCEVYAAFDPSSKRQPGELKRAGRSRTAYVAVAVASSSHLFVVDAWANRNPLEEVYDQLFDSHARNPSILLGVEKVAVQERIGEALAIEGIRRGVTLPVIPVTPTAGADKHARIRAWLRKEWADGRILVESSLIELKSELYAFPSGRTEDLVDALAYAVSLVPPRALAVEVERERARAGLAGYLAEGGLDPWEVPGAIDSAFSWGEDPLTADGPQGQDFDDFSHRGVPRVRDPLMRKRR